MSAWFLDSELSTCFLKDLVEVPSNNIMMFVYYAGTNLHPLVM